MVDPGADYNTGANADSASLAWSSGTEVPDIQGPPPSHGPDDAAEPATVEQSWGTVWSRAVSVLLICLGLAMVILVANWALHHSSNEAVTPSRTTAAPQVATTTTIASTPDQDSRFIAALNEKGIVLGDNEQGITSGKAVCQSFAAGQLAQQIVADFRAANKDHPDYANNAEAFVGVSVRAYCPKYSKQVAGM